LTESKSSFVEEPMDEMPNYIAGLLAMIAQLSTLCNAQVKEKRCCGLSSVVLAAQYVLISINLLL